MSGASDDAPPRMRRLSEILFVFDHELIEQRKSEPYDGILGTLPAWVPEHFNVEFCSIRNRLLHKYSRDGLLSIINAMRESVGIGGILAAVESLDELGAPDDPDYRDIAILARNREVVELGPYVGLAFLTDVDHVMRVLHGEKFPGRKPGSIGRVRAFIRAALHKNPGLTNEALWAAIKQRPPKGWTPMESPRLGRYVEGPNARDNVTYKSFCTYAGAERKLLKIHD